MSSRYCESKGATVFDDAVYSVCGYIMFAIIPFLMYASYREMSVILWILGSCMAIAFVLGVTRVVLILTNRVRPVVSKLCNEVSIDLFSFPYVLAVSGLIALSAGSDSNIYSWGSLLLWASLIIAVAVLVADCCRRR